MDQLADQASDLRSFIGYEGGSAGYPPSAGIGPEQAQIPPPSRSPGSAPGDNSAYRGHRSSFSGSVTASDNALTAAGKRKADDEDASSAKQQRSKRNRYISIACNECKRRKIKCNGQTPCQRCGNLNLQCLYAPNCCPNNFKDSDEFRQMADQVSRLQDQVDRLVHNMNDLRQETLRLAPIQDRILPLPSAAATPSPSASSFRSFPRSTLPPPPRVPPSFSGPTSINFSVDTAKNTLHNMGYTNLVDGQEDASGPLGDTPSASPLLIPALRPPSPAYQKPPPDPLWDFDKDEMIRLCQVHEEEVGIMYPVIKIDTVIEYAKSLATWMNSTRRSGLAPQHVMPDCINDMKTFILKIVMCSALVVEEHGNSPRATKLYESIRPTVDRKFMSERADVNDLPFLALVAGYRFLASEEILAWRVVGHLCRLCMELGLHRREGFENIPDLVTRRNALNTFWTAYVLDRRWSFGTGLPYVCHDDKIDPELPMPDSHPFLVAMITYSRIGARIWHLVDYFEPAVIRQLRPENFENLDREILEWYESVPEEIKVTSLNREIPIPSGPAYDTHRLQIWTRLRLNQIRIWLHTPVLHSASSIADNLPLAQRAVDLAKDTIQYLARLNSTTNLYRRIQVFYHQFLTTSIAVLFLASTHAPLQFSAQCRAEFYMALELVRDMSARSWVSERLWRTIRSLKAYAPRLGLQEYDRHPGGDQPQPAAIGNPGTPSPATQPSSFSRASSFGPGLTPARPLSSGNANNHNIGLAVPGSGASTPQAHTGEDRNNGVRIQTEMSRLYDGYMYLNGGPVTTLSPTSHGQGLELAGGGGHAMSGTGNGGMISPVGGDGVYRHLRDLF